MALSEEDERRVEGELLRMIEELRARPTQEREDRMGLEIAVLPEEERAFVPTALMRLLVREREGRMEEIEPVGSPRIQGRRGFFRRR